MSKEVCTRCGVDLKKAEGSYVGKDLLCTPCLVDTMTERYNSTQVLTEVIEEVASRMRTALGYAESAETPAVLVLVQEICEDYAEKTKLLERVDKYLDRLEAINAERKQGLADLVSCVKDGV